ncbi:MAG: DJ-1/PfpI family protein [Pseudomonadota bacterium]
MSKKRMVGCVLFEGFEILDVMGPVEMFGMHPDSFEIIMVAENRGEVASRQGPKSIADHAFQDQHEYNILLVPGGPGTRDEANNETLLNWLRTTGSKVEFLTSVCTGSALLAKAGLLDGKRATSNKISFDWVKSHGPGANWISQARWVEDGNVFTSSGVSAGMDMTLALIANILGPQAAEDAAYWAEYTWHSDADHDPFAKAAGLV